MHVQLSSYHAFFIYSDITLLFHFTVLIRNPAGKETQLGDYAIKCLYLMFTHNMKCLDIMEVIIKELASFYSLKNDSK
jgi:hypothetical protein